MLQKKLTISRFATIFIAMTWTLVLMTGCMMSEFETIHPPNCAGSFDLPKPVEQPVVQGQKMYVAKQGKAPNGGNLEFWVGVYDRHSVDLPDTAQPAEVLRTFEEQLLKGLQERLTQKGFTPEVKFEGDLPSERAIGQQIRVNVGEQFVLTRFYVAPDALYFFKIDNGDPTNETVKKVLDSINP